MRDSELWQNPERARDLSKEHGQLSEVISSISELEQRLCEAQDLLILADAEQDSEVLTSLEQDDFPHLETQLADLEFKQMFSQPEDRCCAYLDIQAGSGGTDAQDWANILLRMYLRWGERRGFKTELIEISQGEVAGIKSATIRFEGAYAYGWLRTETGVHRLVRLSPFNANARRHTSFAAVFVSPEIDDDIIVAINPADLRIDTYRSSGAGGQHVQKTDSAIRMTHILTGVVVQCQSDRSQHRNRIQAMKQLRAKLYELELRKRRAQQESLESSKRTIGWGSQIRSYVFDDARIKDLRTGVETGNIHVILDGGIDLFLKASLKAGL